MESSATEARPGLLALLLFLWLAGCREPAGLARERVDAAPLRASRHPAQVRIAGEDEPGEPLEVRGQVFAPDGVTPASGVTVYVYQTDQSGLYARRREDPPRLRGWMTTDADGRYAFRSIRPAAYPSRTIAAHVHFQLWGGGWPAQYSEDLLFADDALLGNREHERSRALGRFGPVRTPTRGADGLLACVHDLRLKPEGDELEENILHGVRDEPGAPR